jgi:transposase
MSDHKLMATVNIGYKTYIMPVDEAVALAKTISTAEIYDTKYRSKEEGGSTHHVYAQEQQNLPTVQLVSYEHYRMAKLAGHP